MSLPSGSSLEATVWKKLEEIGCCELCCLRFSGEIKPEVYIRAAEAIKTRGCDEENLKTKIQKKNPCIACLGLLQIPTCDTIVEKLLDEINAADYDCDTFSIAITLPVVYQLRAHSLWLFIDSTYPDFSQTKFPIGCVTISVKDVWKWLFTSFIEERIKKKRDSNSDFFVEICISYEENENECSCLFDMLPDMFSRQKMRKSSAQETFSRKGIEQAFKTVTAKHFLTYYPNLPSVPDTPVACESVALKHKSIFIGGRYNKWSRHLPQTPWIIGGERKMESSVQELISEPLERITKAQDSKFTASGREDVDVRTLGRGRPFSVELINPKRVKLGFDVMRSLEDEINTNGRAKIFVRDLQPVSRESLAHLKTGEEKKSKEYNAFCIVFGPLPSELETLPEKAPVTLNQATPVRVLHRRPIASRQRTIHWFKVKSVSEGKTPEDPSYFTLCMNTQAGTYIKEFIHGDLGRTTPSLGDLLGGASVDILALDVQEVELDWPPPVDYSNIKESVQC